MSTYIISYDLSASGAQNYEALYVAIKAYGRWARITDSTWAIVTEDSAKEVRDYLQMFLSPEDRLFVVRAGSGAAWRNVRCRNQWLKNNL